MNMNEPVLNAAKNRFRGGLMGPPEKPAPKARSVVSSKTSELPWGKSNECLVLNSSNKRSTPSRTTSSSDEDRIIVALTEGRGEARCEVGMAVVNVSKPILTLCQMSDSQSYTNTLAKINIYNPHLIVYPATFETGNRLINEIKRHFPNKKLMSIPRRGFNKENGLDQLYKISIPKSFPLLMMIKTRYYALTATSGLLTYLQDYMYIYYSSNSIKVECETSQGYAFIDIATADRLELVSCNQPAQANKYSTLFGIMNFCVTRIGARNMRSIILQPLYSSKKIQERLDCVEELMRNVPMLLSIQSVLPRLSNVDLVLSLGTLVPQDAQSCNNKQLNYILLLNGIVDTIIPLKEALKNASQPFFVQFAEFLNEEDFENLKNLIRQTIHETAYSAKGQQAEQQRIWALKPGLNGLLDLFRKTYSDRIKDMNDYVKKLGQKYDLPLILANNNKKGYHISLPLKLTQKKTMKRSDLPSEFIEVFRLAHSFTMKTVELVNLSTRVDDILTDLFYLSNLIISDVTVKLKQYVGMFYQLVENISYLDVLQALAEVSAANRWVRPKFDEYTEIIGGRHPLLNFLCQRPPIPNPAAACNHYNLHIITGPNGAGKSIFIRQVMLLQIMAQSGCFVPAEQAVFRAADKMFARISNNDDMESNVSSFTLEIAELNYILTTMTDASLVIIDELCRSTSIEEGTAIAMAICDVLAKSKAFTFITTHFTLLAKLADLFFNIKVWQLQTVPSGDPVNPQTLKLDFRFSLIPGTTTLRNYGIYMVRNVWPPEIMQLIDDLQNRFNKSSQDPKFPSVSKLARLRYDLDCKIDKLKRRNKFTLANLNTLVSEYEAEVQKLGGDTTYYSQNVLRQNMQSAVDDISASGLNHSVFDASRVAESFNISRVYLEELEDVGPPESEDFHSVSQGITIDNASQVSAEVPKQTNISPQPQPDSTSDSNSDESYDSALLCNLYAPEVILSTNHSQCSLNITQQALGIIESKQEHISKNNDQNHQEEAVMLEQSLTDFRREHASYDIPGIMIGERNYGASQRSDVGVTFHRDQEHYLSSQSSLFRPSQIQSPFVNSFAAPLQMDVRKCSTPVNLTHPEKQENSSFGNKANSVNNVTYTTSKLTFTVPKDLSDLDVGTIMEDLESFAQELSLQDGDQTFFSDAGEAEALNTSQKINSTVSNQEHVFPRVIIKHGPSSISLDDTESYEDEVIVTRPVVKGVQPQIELPPTKQQKTDSEYNYTSAEISYLKEVEGINQECDNEYDADTEKHPNELTQHEEKNLINEHETDVELNLQLTSSCELENNKQSPNLLVNINSTNTYQQEGERVTSPDDIYETADSSKSNLSYSPLVPRTTEQEQNPQEDGNLDKFGIKDLNQNTPNTSHKTDFEKSTIDMASQEHSENTKERNLILDRPQTAQSEENTVKFEPNQTSERTEAETLKKNDLFQDIPKANVMQEERLVVISDIVLNTPKKSISRSKQLDFEKQVDQKEQYVNKDRVEEYEINLEEQINLIVSAEQQCRDSVSNVEHPLNLSNNIEPATVNSDLTNPQEIAQIKFTSRSTTRKLFKTKRVRDTNLFEESDSPKKKDAKSVNENGSNSNASEELRAESFTTSVASKLRNLDTEDSSSSSGVKFVGKDQKDVNCDEEVTSLSEASKQRNLDEANTSAGDSKTEKTSSQTDNTHTVKIPQKRKKTNKFRVPLKKAKSANQSQITDVNCPSLDSLKKLSSLKSELVSTKSNSDSKSSDKKFTEISKMSQRAIREEFMKQDKKFFDVNWNDNADFTKLWEERLKRPVRPTPKQIQQSTCLATLRKTSSGVEVIETNFNKSKTKRKPFKPKKTFSSSGCSVNMNIFSDQNAEIFEQFIKSDQKDINLLNFDWGIGKGTTASGSNGKTMFDFKEANPVLSEYTQRSKTWTFVRKKSEELTFPSQSDANDPLAMPTPVPEFNSNGTYASSKLNVSALIKKYL